VITGPKIVLSFSSCWPAGASDPFGIMVSSSKSSPSQDRSCSLSISVAGTEPGGAVRTLRIILSRRSVSIVRASSGYLNRRSPSPDERVFSARLGGCMERWEGHMDTNTLMSRRMREWAICYGGEYTGLFHLTYTDGAVQASERMKIAQTSDPMPVSLVRSISR
jgi:hypothetical protein